MAASTERPIAGKGESPESLLRTESNATYFKELESRMALCSGTRRSNCIGTALYLTCEEKEDVPISGLWAHDYISYLKQTDKPVKGCLISWELQLKDATLISHMGVVTSTEPLLITHRAGPGSEVVENMSFSEMSWYSVDGSYKPVFYLPKMLDDPTQLDGTIR